MAAYSCRTLWQVQMREVVQVAQKSECIHERSLPQMYSTHFRALTVRGAGEVARPPYDPPSQLLLPQRPSTRPRSLLRHLRHRLCCGHAASASSQTADATQQTATAHSQRFRTDLSDGHIATLASAGKAGDQPRQYRSTAATRTLVRALSFWPACAAVIAAASGGGLAVAAFTGSPMEKPSLEPPLSITLARVVETPVNASHSRLRRQSTDERGRRQLESCASLARQRSTATSTRAPMASKGLLLWRWAREHG